LIAVRLRIASGLAPLALRLLLARSVGCLRVLYGAGELPLLGFMRV